VQCQLEECLVKGVLQRDIEQERKKEGAYMYHQSIFATECPEQGSSLTAGTLLQGMRQDSPGNPHLCTHK
jgi:hypothetical protein